MLFRKQNEKIDVQTELFKVQNERINFQNNLIEADRISSSASLMGNILDKVDEEIKAQRKTQVEEFGFVNDSVKFELSNPLINRITALSRTLKAYRVMREDTLFQFLQCP